MLDAFRSCLTPRLVEALICVQDWIKNLNYFISVEESIEALEEFEKGQLVCSIILFNLFKFYELRLCSLMVLSFSFFFQTSLQLALYLQLAVDLQEHQHLPHDYLYALPNAYGV